MAPKRLSVGKKSSVSGGALFACKSIILATQLQRWCFKEATAEQHLSFGCRLRACKSRGWRSRGSSSRFKLASHAKPIWPDWNLNFRLEIKAERLMARGPLGDASAAPSFGRLAFPPETFIRWGVGGFSWPHPLVYLLWVAEGGGGGLFFCDNDYIEGAPREGRL